MSPRQQACGEPVTDLVCKREPGHPGVHETYVGGRTITAPNDRGWRVSQWQDEDGDYWCLVNGAFTDPAKVMAAPLPVKRGAVCGACRGPVNALGCAERCAESERHRIDLFGHVTTDAERLAAIAAICEREMHDLRPEFVSDTVVMAYRLAKGDA